MKGIEGNWREWIPGDGEYKRGGLMGMHNGGTFNGKWEWIRGQGKLQEVVMRGYKR